MIVPANKHFSDETRQLIREIIAAHDNQEVAFCGFINDKGMVTDIEAIGFGNDFSTPFNLYKSLQGDVLIHNHPPIDPDPTQNLKPSSNDIEIATRVQNLGMGFFIIDNTCEYINIVLPVRPQTKLSPENIRAIFEPNGLLSKTISTFESRQEQISLVSEIVDTINNKGVLIAEAGTGTGKSLAYLIPASLWAIANDKKIIVSTHTINLQDQLISKDSSVVIDIIKSITPKPLHVAMLTGRSNYLCKNKLRDLIVDPDRLSSLFDTNPEDYFNLINAIEIWSRQTEHGTRKDYPGEIPSDLWEEIASESETCQGKNCPFAGNCFYQKAYLEAEKAHVLIVNHSLVLSSIDPKTYISFLPRFDAIIFDEAHHLEDVALKSQAIELSLRGLLQRMGRLYHESSKNKSGGLLPLLLRKHNPPSYEDQERLQKLKEKILSQHHTLTTTIQNIIEEGLSLAQKNHSPIAPIRITEEVERSEFFHYLNIQLGGLIKQITTYTATWNEIKDLLQSTSSDTSLPPLLLSIDKRVQNLNEVSPIYHAIFEREQSITEVGWIEVSTKKIKNIKLSHTPLEVGDFLSRGIFSRKHFTLCLSATLSLNGDFSYFKQSIGLEYTHNRPITTISLPSPFDYKNQAQIHILSTEREFKVDDFFLSCIKDYILMNEGGTLVLFTSYLRLHLSYEKLKDDLFREGIYPLAQGPHQKHFIMQEMQKHPRTAVFATSSFWEGVDISGYNLRCVIIEKLPFDSPDDPIPAAKQILLQSRNISPFANYTLPRALLRLKQGMGRLIRSKTDKGIILILDGRTVSRRYAQTFKESLPPARIIIGDYDKLQKEAENFITTHFGSWLQNLPHTQDNVSQESQAHNHTPLHQPNDPR